MSVFSEKYGLRYSSRDYTKTSLESVIYWQQSKLPHSLALQSDVSRESPSQPDVGLPGSLK